VVSNSVDSSSVGIRFSEAVDTAVLNLYDTEAGGLGIADVTLVGDNVGDIAGSLVLDADHAGFHFVATGGVLGDDDYTLTIRSAADAFKNVTGALLDGNADLVEGGDYVLSFNISNSGPIIAIADVVRGPGQNVNIGATDVGIPVSFSDGVGVTSLSFSIDYDPALLSVTGVINGSALPVDASVLIDNSSAGLIEVTITSATGLAAGSQELIRIEASIPEDAPYFSKSLLNMHSVMVNGGALPVTVDDGIQLVAYIGDTTGNHAYSSLDGQNILRNVVRLDGGYAAYPLVDPVLVGDITGNGKLSGLDANRMFQYVMGLNPADIPVLPTLAQPVVVGGLDPTITLDTVSAKPGENVEIHVNVDTIPAGLNGVELWIQYDSEQLELLSVDRGTIPESFDFFFADSSTPGMIKVDTSNLTLVEAEAGGTLAVLQFQVPEDATSNAVLDLQQALLNDGTYTLTPEPVVGPDGSDGLIVVDLPQREPKLPATAKDTVKQTDWFGQQKPITESSRAKAALDFIYNRALAGRDFSWLDNVLNIFSGNADRFDNRPDSSVVSGIFKRPSVYSSDAVRSILDSDDQSSESSAESDRLAERWRFAISVNEGDELPESGDSISAQFRLNEEVSALNRGDLLSGKWKSRL
jgi:hypothetical protein